MLVGYDLSDSDSSDNGIEEETIVGIGRSNSQKVTVDKTFMEKFNCLKERRQKFETEKQSSSKTEDVLADRKTSKKRTKRKRCTDFAGINKYMDSTFRVQPEHDPYNLKKSKLEKEIDEAIHDKDYELAERLNDELANRQFATKVHSAVQAKRYQENVEEKLKHKQKKRKLKWAFSHKQRWETKGNM